MVHEPTVDTPEKELVDDLLSIVTVFASRTYGRRKYKTRGSGNSNGSSSSSSKESQGEDLPDSRGQEDTD